MLLKACRLARPRPRAGLGSRAEKFHLHELLQPLRQYKKRLRWPHISTPPAKAAMNLDTGIRRKVESLLCYDGYDRGASQQQLHEIVHILN